MLCDLKNLILKVLSNGRQHGLVLGCALSVFFVAGCITPPKPTTLPSDSYKAVALVRQGQELARSGRAKRAEEYFREALFYEPDSDAILNDIGYSLLTQQRFEESFKFFLDALKINAENQSARLNLARSYYLAGHLEGAAETFHEILAKQEISSTEADAKKITDKDREISSFQIYRNLAVVYYALGYLDDAICYSNKAFQLSYSMEETSQHARMLLSLDRTVAAIQILQSTIAVHRDAVPANLMFDYGLALITVGNYGLAEEALSRALKKPGLGSGERKYVKSLKLLIDENRRQGTAAAQSVAINYPSPEDNILCSGESKAEPEGLDYWPTSFFDANEKLIASVCSGGTVLKDIEKSESFNIDSSQV